MMRSGRPFGCRRSCDRIYWRHSKCSLMAAMSGGSSKSTIHFKFSQNLLFRIHPLILVSGSMCGKINWSVQCNACDYDNPELEGGEKEGRLGKHDNTTNGGGEGGECWWWGDIGVFLSLVWAPPWPRHTLWTLVDSHGFRYKGRVRGGGGARGCTTGGGGEPVWPGWRVLWRIHSVQYRWKRGAPEGGEPVWLSGVL